jgi:hypothetical protein
MRVPRPILVPRPMRVPRPILVPRPMRVPRPIRVPRVLFMRTPFGVVPLRERGKRVGQSVGLVLVCDCDRGCRPTLVDRPLQFQTCCGTMAFKFLNSLTRITNIESAVGPEPEWTNRDLTYRDKGPVRFVARGRQSLANG